MVFLLVGGFGPSLIKFRGALIGDLVAAGMDVHVAAPELLKDKSLCAELTALGATPHSIDLSRTGTSISADLRTLWQLFLLCLKLRPEFILTYTVKAVIYGVVAAWLARVPNRFALITGLGYSFDSEVGRVGLQALIRRLYKFSLGRAKLIFFQNADDEELFKKLGLCGRRAVSKVVNGSGVDLLEFQYSGPQDGGGFLLIARLLRAKGIREYAAAARNLRILYPNAKFYLAGWLDENPDSIKSSELDAWCAEGCIEYLGPLADVRPALRGCDVYVLPSYREGTPRTVLEAMAIGRAIVTTDAPGCRNTVVEGENGFLVQVASVVSLEAALIRFLQDPSLAGHMGLRSRQIAQDKFDVKKVNFVMLQEMGIEQKVV